jgi:hypothetical protein
MSFRSRSQSSCAGWVAPWDIFSLFVEKTVAYSLSAGKAAALASDPLASSAGSPASGLLHRPAPTAGKGLLAGEAPWPLCALCVSAVNPYILYRQHPSSGKGTALASDPLASSAGSPASGLLHRPAPTAGKGLLAGEAPWPLCALCVSAVNPYILQRQHPSSGKGTALASDPLASSAGSPASGLLHRPAPTAGKGLLAGEAPWPLCALCVSASLR